MLFNSPAGCHRCPGETVALTAPRSETAQPVMSTPGSGMQKRPRQGAFDRCGDIHNNCTVLNGVFSFPSYVFVTYSYKDSEV